MTMQSTLARRQLLNAMGLTASSLFLPSLAGRKLARAATTPKRLLVFYTPHGPVNQRWQMRPAGPHTWSDTKEKPDRSQELSFSLKSQTEDKWSQILKPLYPLRDKLLVVEGLSMASALLDVNTNNHNAGTSHALTGAKMVYPGGFKMEGAGGGSSIDQLVADKIADPNRIRSFYFSTGGWSPVFRGKIEQRAETAPDRAYDKLFPVSATGDATLDLVKQRRPSAIAAVAQQYKKFAARLASDDRKKLEDHFALVSDLERSLAFRSAEGGKCVQRPSSAPAPAPGRTVVDVSKDFGGLITAAFACDMTRVAVLQMGQPGSGELVTALNIHTDLHADVAHGASPDRPKQYGQMAGYYAYLASNFATVLGQLNAVTVDAGRTLLDDTVCLWLCELANGPHEVHDIMAVVAGGGDAFSLGRYVKHAESTANPRSANGAKIGPAHNKLLTSVANVFGVETQLVGSPASDFVSKRPSAANFDLTGVLPLMKT